MYAPQNPQDPIVFLAQQMQAFQQQLAQIAEVVGALQQQVMQQPSQQQWPNNFQQPGGAQVGFNPQQQGRGAMQQQRQQQQYQPQGWPQAPGPQQYPQQPQQPLPGQRQFTTPQEDEQIAGMLGMEEYQRSQPSFPMPGQQAGPQAAPNEVIVARMLRMAQMQQGMGG